MMCWYRTPRDAENEGRHGKRQRSLGFTLSSEGGGTELAGERGLGGEFRPQVLALLPEQQVEYLHLQASGTCCVSSSEE